jgi:hypothetical protein
MGMLRQRIMDCLPHGRNFYCQYCLISQKDELDHYVPKGPFPEFSILARNLIPCCSICNRLKGEVWLPHGVRTVFHLYYEDLPAAPFLRVAITFPAVGGAKVSFSLYQHQTVSQMLYDRLEAHFTQLDLLERLNGAGADLVSERLNSALQNAWPDRLSLSRLLINDAQAEEGRLGQNYWKAVIVRELAISNGFFSLLGL